MADSMIERIANLLWETSHARVAAVPAGVHRFSWEELSKEAMSDPVAKAWWDRTRQQGRQVLAEMREPTTTMISDGAFQLFRGERITDDDLAAARRVWRAMTRTAGDGSLFRQAQPDTPDCHRNSQSAPPLGSR